MVDLGGLGYNTTIFWTLFNPYLKMLWWLSHPVQSSIYRWFSHSNFHLSRWCPWFSNEKNHEKISIHRFHSWPWVKTYGTIFGWLFTSINPSYFDVNKRGTGFWPITICAQKNQSWPSFVGKYSVHGASGFCQVLGQTLRLIGRSLMFSVLNEEPHVWWVITRILRWRLSH